MRKNYVVRDGDTLRSVSERYYGHSGLWSFLALINFKYNLKENDKIRVPDKWGIAFPVSIIITVSFWLTLIIEALPTK